MVGKQNPVSTRVLRIHNWKSCVRRLDTAIASITAEQEP